MKLINVKVIANAKRNEVTQEQGRLKVRCTAPAVDGRANKAVIELLAGHMGVKKGRIKIAKGEKSDKKVIEVH